MKKTILVSLAILSVLAWAEKEVLIKSAGVVLPVFSSDSNVPWVPAKGELIYNSTDQEVKFYDGGWNSIPSEAQPPAAKFTTTNTTTLSTSFTAFDFSSGDINFDSASGLDHTNNKYVVPQDGIYMISAYGRSDSLSQEAGYALAYKIGAGSFVEMATSSRTSVGTATYMGVSGSTLVQLSQNDELYVGALRNTASYPNISRAMVSIFRVRD